MVYRVVAPPYMNSRPLVWGLRQDSNASCAFSAPSRIARMLEAREIHAGLVSIAALFTNPRLAIVSDISISCKGQAESVKMFHKVPVEQIRTVALDTSSLSSVLLARIILQERFGLTPKYVSMPPAIPGMLEICDAAVTIGDVTMCADSKDYEAVDLGQEWYNLTGLPFVFAVWALDTEMYSDGLIHALLRSKRLGIQSLEEIAQSESQRLGLHKDICYHYLANIMQYDLTDLHLQAIALFRQKALEHRLVTSKHSIEVLGTAGNLGRVPAYE